MKAAVLAFLKGVTLYQWLIVSLLILAGGAVIQYTRHERQIGRDQVLIHAADSIANKASADIAREKHRGDSLLKAAQHSDSLLKDKARTFNNGVVKYKLARDTVNVLDTAAVKAVLALADSAIDAGDKALAQADSVISNLHAVIANQQLSITAHEQRGLAQAEIIRILKREKPGTISHLGNALKLAGVAVVAFEAGKRL